MLHGAESKMPLAQFGEQVMGRPGGQMHLSKALPRWKKGVWVGVNPQDGGHILLDKSGFFICREVNRVVPSQQWDKEALETCAGLPWSRHEGSTEKFAPVLAQANYQGIPVAQTAQATGATAIGKSEAGQPAPRTPAGMEPHAREGASATQASAASADVARGSGDALPTGTATRGAKRSGGESLVDPRLEPASPRAASKQNLSLIHI